MRIAITGSTSSLGEYLIEALKEQGIEVVALGGRKSNLWKLGEPFPTSITADVLIHLAHDRHFTFEENILAVKVLCDSFEGYKIFISSISAHSTSQSVYGKSKFASEQNFTGSGGLSLRAGIVYGDKIRGIDGQIQRYLSRLPILPMPFSGRSRLFTTHIDDLVQEIIFAFRDEYTGIVLAAHPFPLSFGDLVRLLNDTSGFKKRIYLIPVPTFLTKFGIFVMKLLLPHSTEVDSLRSLADDASLEELGTLLPSKCQFRPRFSL